MKFGGNSPDGDDKETVELYNWKTGEQCQLRSLHGGAAAHTGVVMDGRPAYCGGYSTETENRCYEFDIATTKWIEVTITTILGCKDA